MGHAMEFRAPVSVPDITEGVYTDPGKRGISVSTPYHHRLQRRHFALFEVLPLLGTLFATGWAFYVPVGWLELVLFFVLWQFTAIGITLAYHRHMGHQAFQAKPWVRTLLFILACMATQGPPLSWAAFHRLHHSVSDQPGDPHSPNLHGPGWWNRLRGLLHAQILWMYRHDYPSAARYIPDLRNDKLLWRIDRWYLRIAFAGLALPALIGWIYYGTLLGVFQCFLWGGVVRLFVLDHIIWFINSALHTAGRQPFATGDGSRNGVLISFLTFGESFHNNHHAFPGSAAFGLCWYQPDPAYWILRGMAALGWVWDVRVPSEARIQARLAVHPSKAAHAG